MKKLRSGAVLALITIALLGVAAAPAQAAPKATTLAFDAKPEPIRRGSSMSVSGQLKSGTTVLRSRTIYFYFRKNGTSTYAYKGNAKTNSQGRYTRWFTAQTSGTWKAYYVGSPTYRAAIAYDAVTVTAVVPRVVASYSGVGNWQSPTIRIPLKDYSVSWAYNCTDPTLPIWVLMWDAPPYGFEYLVREGLSGSGTFYGHDGARSGHFEVGTQGDCRWRFQVRAGYTAVAV